MLLHIGAPWGLLHAAVEDPNPVIFLEHKLLYRERGPVPRRHHVPLGQADVRRRGEHLTIVATSIMVGKSLAAADELAKEGIEVTVVDPRTLKPLDEETILAEVAATGRALLVQEAVRSGGFMAEVAARIAESDTFHSLRAPHRQAVRPGRPDGLRTGAGKGIGAASARHHRRRPATR